MTTISQLTGLRDDIINNNTIPNEKFEDYDVKRGLRNKDGSGVLAGLTTVSSVVGAKHIDYHMEPVEGELNYRGIPIFDLVKDLEGKGFGFERAVFLLLVGRLPEEEELSFIQTQMGQNRSIPTEVLENVIKGVPSKHIMNKLQTSVSALYAFDDNPDSIDPFDNFEKAVSLIAKFPIIVAYSYLAAYVPDATFVTPDPSLSQAEAFLTVLNQGQAPSELEINIVDLAMILHAEHGGGNNSSFTTRVVSSSATDIYSALAAAVGSLKGPLHGAANKKVMDMMADIKDNVSDWNNTDQINDYLTRLINKEAHDKSGKIYGLGHAVYTKSDPRAVVLKEYAERLAKEKNRLDEYNLYLTIESEGPRLFQEIKGSKKVISPNVDFFSGFVYDCLGIPQAIYTPIFAMARACGWSAHRMEELISGKRIIRPGYKWVADS